MQSAISSRCEQLLAAASLRSFHKEAIKVEEVGPDSPPQQEGPLGDHAPAAPSPSGSALGKRKPEASPEQPPSSKRKKKGKHKKKGKSK